MARLKREVTWSPRAIADLEGIWRYYVEIAGPDTAEVIVREIHEAAGLLATHQFAGRARDDIRPELRSIIAAPHVLFYHVTDDAPQIVRVLDGRQDIDDIFLIEPR
jgi:toxin ParE1/3/4